MMEDSLEQEIAAALRRHLPPPPIELRDTVLQGVENALRRPRPFSRQLPNVGWFMVGSLALFLSAVFTNLAVTNWNERNHARWMGPPATSGSIRSWSDWTDQVAPALSRADAEAVAWRFRTFIPYRVTTNYYQQQTLLKKLLDDKPMTIPRLPVSPG